MDLHIFITVFTLIFLAELPDKTAFATFLMATRGGMGAVFSGVATAFFVQCLVAVGFGSLIGLLPEKWVHLGAGVLFIAFAAHTWFFHDKEEEEVEKESPVLSAQSAFMSVAWKAFVVIFIAEWGDFTQIATASMAARFHENPFTVFSAAVLALWSVTAIAVFLGKKIGHAVHSDVIKKISTVLFAGVGVYFVVTALQN